INPNDPARTTGIARSHDGGETWEAVGIARRFNTNADHARLAIDRDPSSPFRDSLYVSWFHFGSADGPPFQNLEVSRSRDGGVTWSAAVAVGDPSSAFANALAIGPQGVVYSTRLGAIDPAGGAKQFVNVSVDGGATFGPDVELTDLHTDASNFGTGFSFA